MIISVGDIMLDIYIEEPDALNRDTDTRGRTELKWGGSASNFAVWTARLGFDSAIVGRAGSDFTGDAAIQDFESEGVKAVITKDGHLGTGTVVVRNRGAEGREMICDRRANAAFCEKDLPLDEIRNARWVHISGYTAIEDEPRKAVRKCIEASVRAGVDVSVDPGSCSLIGSLGAGRFLDAVKGARVLLPNLEEAKLITRKKTPDGMAEALLEHFPIVIIKLGAQGAFYSDRMGNSGNVPAFSVEAIDVNGAGDAFDAAFATKFINSGDIGLSTEAGCALAALVVVARGARPSIDIHSIRDRYFGKSEGKI